MITLSESELLGNPLSDEEWDLADFLHSCELSRELYDKRDVLIPGGEIVAVVD